MMGDRTIPKNLSRVPDRQLPRPVAALRRKPSTTSIPYASYHTNTVPPTFMKRVATAAKERPTRTVAGAVVLLFVLWWLVFSVTFESEHVHPMLAQMAVPSGGSDELGKTFDDVKRRKSILNGVSPRSSSILPAIPFTPKEELASLVNFLVSNPSHSLPLNIDPTVPLLPDMILDVPLPSSLDCRIRVLEEMQKDTWERWPVVVIGRVKETALIRELLMNEQYLGKKHHGMGFLETNSRPDLSLLVPILARLTGRQTTPIIIIGGKNIGSYHDLKALDNEDGELEDLLREAGSTLGLEKIKRVEKERLLRIAMEKIRASLPIEEREDVTLEAIAEAVAEVVAEEAVAEEARDEAVAEEKREKALELSQEEFVEEEAMAQDAMDRALADEAKEEALRAIVEGVLDGEMESPFVVLEEEEFVINQAEDEFTPGEIEEFVINEDDYQPQEEDDYDFQPLEA